MSKQIFYQIIFVLLIHLTKSSDEIEVTLNFCEFGDNFYREMVFSLIGEFQFIYIEKLKELYVSMKKRLKELNEHIFDLREVNIKNRNRTEQPIKYKFSGLISDVYHKINKSYSLMDEMGLIVTDGKSAECAEKITEGKYEKAAQILTEIENNGLIYSIVTIVYNGYGPRIQNLACENLFGFTSHLNQRGMQYKSAAVYISLFSVLIENKMYYSECMLKLTEFGKIDYEKLSSIKIYSHQYATLAKRYRYIKDGSSSIVRKIVYGNTRNNQWCIYNLVQKEYLIAEQEKIFTKKLTKFEANSKWTLEYQADDQAYRIKNFRFYLEISLDLQTNRYQKEINGGNDDDPLESALWTIIPLNENEITIESFSSKDKLISGPDTDFYKKNSKRHVFAHNHEFAQLPVDGIDRWTLKEC